MQILIKEPDQRLDLSKVRRILSIHHMLAMGEVVLLSVPFGILKANLPKASLSVIAGGYACRFLSHISAVDRSIPIERFGIFLGNTPQVSQFLYRPFIVPLLALFLRRHRFDCVFIRDDERLPYTRYIRQAVRVARVPKVVRLKPLMARFFNAQTHVVDSYRQILGALDLQVDEIRRPTLQPQPSGVQNARRFLTAQGIFPDNHCIVGLCPTSNVQIKNWSPEKAAALCQRLAASDRIRVLLFTTDQAYQERLSALTAQLPVSVGMLPFGDLIGLIAQCNAFVSVDTGPMHVAAALDIPIVGLFGPTSGQMFGPLGQRCQVFQQTPKCPHYHPDAFFVANDQKFQQCYIQNRCLLAEHSCVDRISAETVGATVETLIA